MDGSEGTEFREEGGFVYSNINGLSELKMIEIKDFLSR